MSNTSPAEAGQKSPLLSRVVRASEATVVPKFLIAGEHGAGKTHAMSSTGDLRLFAVVFEGNQSKSTIRTANPDADIFEVKNIKDWRDLYRVIQAGELSEYDVLGIDSLNEMQAYYDRDFDNMQKEVAKEAASAAQKKGPFVQAKPKENKWEKYRALKTNMGNVFHFLRDLPIAVAATIRTKTEMEEETGIQRVKFSLDGDARNNVGAHFTATTYIYKIEGDEVGTNRRCAMFTGPENFPCREMGVLRGICVPSVGTWMRALRGEDPEALGLYIKDARMPGVRNHNRPSTDTF